MPKAFAKLIPFFLLAFFLSACGNQPAINPDSLAIQLQTLDKKLDTKQAQLISKNVLTVSKEIKEEFDPLPFPWFNNFLVNIGLKEKGLCWEYRDALLLKLKPKVAPLTLLPVVANIDKLNEHNAVVIASKDTKFQDTLLVDLWRKSGELYIIKVGDDRKYKWSISFSNARCVYSD